MANATPKGAIRPKNTQTLLNSDGTESTITWIREATAIKRLRRHLAKSGCSLHITREGSAERLRHGEYFITEADGRLVDDKINLSAWLRAYNLLAPLEMIDPPLGKGWRFYIARQKCSVIDGITIWDHDRLTGVYTTEKAARKAAEGIVDREGLIIVGYDSRKGGEENANP